MSTENNSRDISQKLSQLHERCQSLILSTLDAQGAAKISYTPFVDFGEHMYIFISNLAHHCQQLREHPQAQAMLIQDESSTRNIYARERLIYDIQASVVPRQHELFSPVANKLLARHGHTVSVLLGLPDFVMFELKRTKGSLVLGFGQAYVFDPMQIEHAIQLNDKNITHYR